MSERLHQAERPRRAPTHPGAILREDMIPSLELSVTTVARELGVSRVHLGRVLSERNPVSPEMALRLGRYFGNGAEFWQRLQDTRTLWETRRKLGNEIQKIPQRQGSKGESA